MAVLPVFYICDVTIRYCVKLVVEFLYHSIVLSELKAVMKLFRRKHL